MRFWVVLCFLAALILSVSVAAQAQLGVQVTPPPPKVSKLGDFVTLIYIVLNTGTVEDSYDLRTILPGGFQLIGVSPSSVTLNAGLQENVFVTLLVLPTVRAGLHEIKLQATSRTDPNVAATGVAVIEVLPASGVVIQPPRGQKAQPGDTVSYIFVVINSGNVLDTFEFSARSSSNFLATVDPSRAQFAPGERVEVHVTLLIPQFANAHQDILLFRATSTAMPQVFAEARVPTTILPLAFEQVPIFLGLELATLVPLATTIGPLSPPIVDSLASDVLIMGELPGDFLLSSTIPISLLPAPSVRAFSLSLRQAAAPGFPSSGFVSVPTQRNLSLLTPSLAFGLFSTADGLQRAIRMSLASKLGAIGLLALRDEAQNLTFIDVAMLSELKLGLVSSGLSLGAAGAIGANDNTAAFRINLTAVFVPLFVDLDLAVAGAHLGNFASFTGSLSFPLMLDPLALSSGFVLGLMQSNIAGDPSLPGLLTQRFQASALATLTPFNLDTAFSIEQTQGDSLFPTDHLAADLTLNAGVTVDLLSLRFSHSQTLERDNLAMTQSNRQRQSVELTLHPDNGAILTASLFRSIQDGIETNGISFTIGYRSLSLVVHQTSFVDSGIGLTTTVTFNLPFTIQVPAIPVKGRVEGIVFIDENDNNRFDPGEEGVPNLILTLDDSQALSNPQGRFRFPPSKPGSFRLNIPELPVFFEPQVTLPLMVTVRVAQVTFIEIPTRRVSGITGVVFNDVQRNGVRDRDEAGLAGVRLILRGQPLAQQFVTGADGLFRFHVPPGDYRLILDSTTLPTGFELTTPGEVFVTLKQNEIITVDFGAAEKPRPVKFAPVANFLFKPERPKPGETVTFDASLSSDSDGQIIRYEWDFNNDGIIDAIGKVVTYIFMTAGDFPVRLVVTDNDGLQDSVTKIVPVRP